jgi:histidyl-tRNA synthetase
MDKGNRSITLKPEGTAGVARAFIENGMHSTPMPAKMFYITQCFRYERPQAGRLREFHQFGVEFLGSDAPQIDAEVILLAKTFLDNLGINNVSLFINSIGCPKCRENYSKALREFFGSKIDNLCPLCKDRLGKNPMRILDCKNPECKEITKNAPSILDYICDDCNAHFESVKSYLDSVGVKYQVDAGIVRGLDYYTKTVFEFVSNNIGAQGTVCGGGRYNGLIAQLGGTDLPGIGFATGIERLLMVMENSGVNIENNNGVDVYLAPLGEVESKKTFVLTKLLRDNGIKTETDFMNRGVKSQFKYADKIGAKYVGVIGSDELEVGKIKIKRMSDGQENFVELDNLVDFFKKEGL